MSFTFSFLNAFTNLCGRGFICVFALMVMCELFSCKSAFAEEKSEKKPVVEAGKGESNSRPKSKLEARVRAHLLYETIHGALQVMHRDFFDEEESLSIPSHSLEDVFKEISRSHGIQVRWLAVNAKAMNIDNKAKTDFEKASVEALSNGKESFEESTIEEYRFTGAVLLSSQCLKCHHPARTSNKSKVAGLVITIPFRPTQTAK